MTGALSGFATIGVVIAVGFVLAHLKVLDESAQVVLTKLTFLVGSPALMITVLGAADVHTLFSTNLTASLVGVLVTATAQVLLARLVWHRSLGETVIGAFCSSYVNAGNLGLPIAAYAIGDASVIAPMLLAQLVVLQPLGLAMLDVDRARTDGELTRGELVRTAISRPFRNPITIGSLIGMLLSVTGWTLPSAIGNPLDLIAGIAIPAMLISYGISLRTGPLPGRGENPAHLTAIVLLKLIVQPLLAWLFGAYVLGLTGTALLAVTVIAALPTAQNVYLMATRYETGRILARDAIFLTTILSVPVIVTIAALLD